MDLIAVKILLKEVGEHLMCFPLMVFRAFSAGDRQDPQFCIHIFMHSQGIQNNACSFQIGLHHTVTINAIVLMIDLFNLLLNALLFFPLGRLAMLSIVIYTKAWGLTLFYRLNY